MCWLLIFLVGWKESIQKEAIAKGFASAQEYFLHKKSQDMWSTSGTRGVAPTFDATGRDDARGTSLPARPAVSCHVAFVFFKPTRAEEKAYLDAVKFKNKTWGYLQSSILTYVNFPWEKCIPKSCKKKKTVFSSFNRTNILTALSSYFI